MMIDKKEMRDLHLFSLPVNYHGSLRKDQTVQDILNLKTAFGFEGEDQIEVYVYPYYNDGIFPDNWHPDENFYLGNLVDLDISGNVILYRIIIDSTLVGDNFYTMKKLATDGGPCKVVCARFNYLDGFGTITNPRARIGRIDFMVDDREIPFVFPEAKPNHSVTTSADAEENKEESSNA